MTGPPTRKPYCFSLKVPYAGLVGALAHEILVAAEIIGRTGEHVGAAAGDGVQAAAGEAALADVVGGDDQLEFLHGVERDRRGQAGCAAAAQAEQVVVHGAVDLDVVVAVALAGGREGAAAAGVDLGGQAGEVVERTADRRHALDDAGGNVLGGAGACLRK